MNRKFPVFRHNLNPIHYRGGLANKEFDEFNTDNSRDRLRHLKVKENAVHIKYWEKNPFTYKFNNFGFRSNDDFHRYGRGNIFLGCSHTEGIGWPLNETWSKRIHDKIGGENFFNFGTGGGSIATGRRYLQAWAGYLNAQNVFVCFPHPYRYDYFSIENKCFNTMLPGNYGGLTDDNLPKALTEEYMAADYYVSNLTAIYCICKEHDLNLYVIQQALFKSKDSDPIKDRKPRDFIHMPKSGQDGIYNTAIELYENNKVFTYDDIFSDKFYLG